MKKKKKHMGTKAKIREEKKRERLIGTIITVFILVAIIIVPGYLIYSYLNSQQSNQPPNDDPLPTFQLKAAIVDQLSLTQPNQSFVQIATNILTDAGYAVNYYPGERVNIEFYRNLAKRNFKLILLRVHSLVSTKENKSFVELFTSEYYTVSKYYSEQLNERVTRVGYYQGELTYFGISNEFIKHSMNGQFNDTTVIMMGCDGLNTTVMAEAFTQKGAKVYVGWDGSVLSRHTDQATTRLLRYLITEKQMIKQAVESTMEKVGPDPDSRSMLLYYLRHDPG